MLQSHQSIISHIIANKQLVAASIFLCLAIVFIFSVEESGHAKELEREAEARNFVIKDQENASQAIDVQDAAFSTKTDSIIFEKIVAERTQCGTSRIIAVQPDFSADLTKINLKMPILIYHYIERPGSTTLPWLYHPPEIFEAQLKTLNDNCYNSIFVSDAAKAVKGSEIMPDKAIALTFDDGYEDMYTEAYPLLKKYGMKGTMYIIVNALGTPGYLTKAQVKEMADSGFVEIAGHTFNHIVLSKASDKDAYYEIAGSKRELEKIIDHPVTDFAYPYGLFTSIDEQICAKAGYLSCASTYPGQIQTYAQRFSLFRLRPGYRVGPVLINWLESAGPKR